MHLINTDDEFSHPPNELENRMAGHHILGKVDQVQHHTLENFQNNEIENQRKIIIEHQTENNQLETGSCSSPKSASHDTLNANIPAGLDGVEWEKFKVLLNKMGVSPVPIKKKDRTRKTGGKGSSRKGLRELKILKFDINYEKERGMNITNRVNNVNQ